MSDALQFPIDLCYLYLHICNFWREISLNIYDISPGFFLLNQHIGRYKYESKYPQSSELTFIDSYMCFKVSIVIGVPTIKRERESYLVQTITSLIDSLNEEERRDCLIVVFVGEVGGLHLVPLSNTPKPIDWILQLPSSPPETI